MKSTQSALQRILRVEKFYERRGVNKESVNNVKRKILAVKFNKSMYESNNEANTISSISSKAS